MQYKLEEIKNPIVLITIGIIFAATFYYQELSFTLFLIFLSLGVLSTVFLRNRKIAILLISVVLSYSWICFYIKSHRDSYLYLKNKPGIFIGEIISDAEDKHFYKKYQMLIKKIILPEKTFEVNFKAEVRGSKYEEYSVGDFVQVKGELKLPKKALLYGLYDESKNLRIKDIYFILEADRSTLVYLYSKPQNYFLDFITLVRGYILELNKKYLYGNSLGIVNGIVLGSKASPLPKDFNIIIKDLGLSHITSASGFNLSILTGVVFYLSRLYSGTVIFPVIVSVFVILIYTFLADLSSSIIRSSIFLVLVLVGLLFGKNVKILPSVSLITILFFLFNPNNILDVGFQLSVFSFLGLTLFLDELKTITKAVKNKVLDILILLFAESFFAQLLTFPIILFYFHNVQILGLVSNLLAVPLSSFILVWSLVCISFSFIFRMDFISICLYKILFILSKFFLLWVEILNHIPFKKINFPGISYFSLLLIYASVVLLSSFIFIKNYRKTILFISPLIVFCFLLVNFLSVKPLQIFCIPAYNNFALLISPPNENPIFLSNHFNKKLFYNVEEFARLNNISNKATFFNFKNNKLTLLNSKYVHVLQSGVLIRANLDSIFIPFNMNEKIHEKSSILILPYLLKTNLSFSNSIGFLPPNVIVNDYKKLSKSSLNSIKWLKSKPINKYFLSMSGTITVACPLNMSCSIDPSF